VPPLSLKRQRSCGTRWKSTKVDDKRGSNPSFIFRFPGIESLAFPKIYATILGMLTKRKKENAIKDVKLHKADTGSTEAQVAILSKKIDELAKHLKKNKKDVHSRKGLLGMVSDRKSHLKYLEKKDPKRYKSLIKKLGLKK
jgi:small subunit ribosomal protein S15